MVYEAIDRDRNARVALKTLRGDDPEILLRFKNEFRSLQDIRHENLVLLHELLEASGQLFFTMELVDGTGFLDHVRAESPAAPSISGARQARRDRPTTAGGEDPPSEVTLGSVDDVAEPATHLSGLDRETRLRRALAQLAEGLTALHQAGKVHRDVKPSNVLVTPSGRVAILDFGLITDATRPERAGVVVGTPNYMAPEQAFGRQVGPAADWYAVGVMLYRALTGAPPFDLRGARTAAEHRAARGSILAPRDRAPEVPPDLESLCMDLLKLDPAQRPPGSAVLARLGVAEEAVPSRRSRALGVRLIGRERELAILAGLREQARRRAVVVTLEGESGLGKSTLWRRFLDGLKAEAIVLSGRCYERATIPFNAVDELMDEMGTLLARLPRDEALALLPPEVARLEQVFPVLKLSREQVAPAPPALEQMDPVEQRARLFAAARALVARLAERGPLVLAIDDVQWADADSLALLAEALRAPAPPLLLVMTLRTGPGVPAAAVVLPKLGVPVERVAVAPMSEEDSSALVGAILGSLGAEARTPSDLDAREIAREAGGHPLLLDALVRHRVARGVAGPVRLDDAFWARIDRLPPRARTLLEPIALAGAPVRLDVIEQVAGVRDEEARRLLARLLVENLVRLTGAGRSECVEPYHDRVREAVADRLDEPTRRRWHGRLAEVLESTGVGRLDELAAHWRHAGSPARAAGYAERAGDEAATSFAFDHAARLYQLALDPGALAPEADRRVAEKLGQAHANAGRGREAAGAFLRASRGAEALPQLELKRRAGDAFLGAGYVDEGITLLREVARALGVSFPEGPTRSLLALLANQLRLRLRGDEPTPRTVEETTPQDRLRIDLCWSAAKGIVQLDPVRGAYFTTQSLLLALDEGDAARVGRALAMHTSSTAAAGARDGHAGRLARAEQLGRFAGSDAVLGLTELCRGATSFNFGHFQPAMRALRRAEKILRERCTGVAWEIGTTVSYLVWGLWYTGRIEELGQRFPEALRESESRGDRYLAANLRASMPVTYWLYLHDDPPRARREIKEAMGVWSNREGFQLQHLLAAMADALVEMYVGQPAAAHQRLRDVWLQVESSLLIRVHAVRIIPVYFSIVSAVAAASPRDGARLREAERMLARLNAEVDPWAHAFGACAGATLATRRGDRAGARALLDLAVARMDLLDMRSFAMAARYRRGELVGGDAGRAEVERAVQWHRDQGVLRPDRAVNMLLPG